MSALRNIATAVASARDEYAALEYKKGAHNTGEGDRYEERVLALVFLRCLRRGVIFQLSANNGEAGKFDDVVLVWRPEGHSEAHTILVQLKHKTSPNYMTIDNDQWLSEAPNCDFGLGKYCTSYEEISKSLGRDRVVFVLLTNASLGASSPNIFESQEVDGVLGLELLRAGGRLYSLNRDNQGVLKAVRDNDRFMENFYLLCQQRNSDEIVVDIYKELEELLGAGGLCESICDSLCKNLRHWMNKENVCLTSSWSKWQVLVDDYIKKNVTQCRSVTTGLKYCNVATVRGYLESCNTAWVKPPERGTAALTATKIHQALADETHIMVAVEQFRQLKYQILRCWGRFCRWLVIVDDDRECNSDILSELPTQMPTECRLVIVSSRRSDCFDDTCRSYDVSDESWNKCLDVKVVLNGEYFECCRLRDLVAGVDAIKSLLDNKPALLLALARVTQPLRLGKDLETLPVYYVPRELVDKQLLTDEFFSTLNSIQEYDGEWEKVQPETTAHSTIIVVGRPGVGKSKVLSHVAKKIKERLSGCWLLRVNLLEFYTVLDDNDRAASAAKDILRRTVFNEGVLGKLEYAVLRHSLVHSPRVVCLVDGFDEVCPDYVNKCLEVLPLLAPRKGKLLVTTRPEPVRLLETRTGVSAQSLLPFGDSELEDFFRRHPSREKIRRISGLNKSLRDLLRIPLFAEMFANLSQEIDETYDIVTLYEAFFQHKFRRLYKEKWGDNFSAPGKRREIEEAQQRHQEQLMVLAASVLLRGKEVPAKPSFDREYLVKAGIVYEFADGKPAFLHRTFAEHFLAKWCFLRQGKRSRATVYRKAYVNERLEFFLESFDRMAARGCPLLEAALDGDEGRVKALLDEGVDPKQVDAFGRNVLHLAAANRALAYDQRCPLSLLRRQCSDDTWRGMLSAEDGLLGWTPMKYAVEGRHWLVVHELLETGGDLSQLWDFQTALPEPAQLQAVLEQSGYLALYRHVIEAKHPLKTGSYICMMEDEIEFALSLIFAKVPRECLKVIADEASERGHMVVWGLLSRACT
ncbi:uncharacterized protein LOC126210469 [Schistocerca nitens]|uniref:uncharacterized protein LOC126210469 n=1 Tax=Schistocerca nitens TaxID=7011 RepID=UPI002118364B|nr:uncharacterized protein LOC126210469 [Schistocerca nitens]XP_049795663.1 uncharacterized protein LOC126210469 [Schistocerca nitens]